MQHDAAQAGVSAAQVQLIPTCVSGCSRAGTSPLVERPNARGFSLLELMVALAIATVIVWLLFHALSQALLAARMQARDDLEQSTIGQLVDTLTSEQDDAWAIYVPPADVHGASNGDGHEVDFFARDGKQRPYFWAYTYDKSAQTLTRYRFSAPGGIARQDTTYAGITKFYARTYPVTGLQDRATPIYSALYDGAALQSGVVRFYPSMPWIAGGNNITYVHIEGASMKQDLQLATNTAPSGFTVVVYYTPSPVPVATPAALGVWPAGIKLAAPGTMLAAGTCTAVAYNDARMTQRLAANSVNPYTGAAATDGNGCYIASASNSAQFWVHEANYSGIFGDGPSSCGSGITEGVWSPTSALGPTAGQTITANADTNGICAVAFDDSNQAQVNGNVEVIGACGSALTVGGQCFATVSFTPPAQCGQNSNPIPLLAFSYTITPAGAATYDQNTGILTSSTNGLFTFTGNYSYAYEYYSSFYKGCMTKTYTTTKTWTFN